EVGALGVAAGDPDHALGGPQGGGRGGGVGRLGVVHVVDAVDGGEVLRPVRAHPVGPQPVADRAGLDPVGACEGGGGQRVEHDVRSGPLRAQVGEVVEGGE